MQSEEIITEFLYPDETEFNFIVAGDEETKKSQQTINKIIKKINEFRSRKKLNKIKPKKETTSSIYRGSLLKEDKDPTLDVIYFDEDLTKDVINVLTNQYDHVDELDAMLINEFIIHANYKKFIFNIGKTKLNTTSELFNIIDGINNHIMISYVVVDNLMIMMFEEMGGEIII